MGVKSFGWENRTAQEPPIQSWKRILPSVVWASKSGAISPICSAMTFLPLDIQHSDFGVYIVARRSRNSDRAETAIASPAPGRRAAMPIDGCKGKVFSAEAQGEVGNASGAAR